MARSARHSSSRTAEPLASRLLTSQLKKLEVLEMRRQGLMSRPSTLVSTAPPSNVKRPGAAATNACRGMGAGVNSATGWWCVTQGLSGL